MSSNLPVPTPRRDLVSPGLDLPASQRGAGRAWHQRSPRLERVTCLDCHAGLLAAGGGRVCCVWDMHSQAVRLRIVVDETIAAVWMTRDRACIAIAAGSTVGLYELTSGELRFAYRHAAELTSVHVGSLPAVLASADVSGRIQIRELASGRLMQDLQHPSGRPIVFVHHDHVLIESQTHSTLVDLATGESVRRFSYSPFEAQAPDAPTLNTTLVSHSGSTLRWFDCKRHEAAFCTRDLGSPIQSIDIFDDLVLAATENGALHLFALLSGAPRARYDSFTRPLMFARFGERASIMVAGGEALVMQLVRGRHVSSYYDESPPLVAMALHAGRQALLVSDRDGGVAHFDLHDGQRKASFAGHAGSVSVVVSGDAGAASGAYDGSLRLWHWDGSPATSIELAQGPVQSIALDPVAGRVWAGSWSGHVTGLDLATGATLTAMHPFSSSVRTLAIDSTGQRLCAGGDDGELTVFDLRGDGPPLLEIKQPGTAYRALFDADGDLLTTAADGVRRYRGLSFELCMTYPGNGIRWFDMHAGRLCSLSLDGELRLFDLARAEVLEQAQIDVPTNHRSVAWLNARRLLTASGDGLVRVFDAQLRQVATLELLRHGFLWCTPGHDGRTGWLFTDRADLVDVGELRAGVMTRWDTADTRRARHLAVWNSASHVMQVVTANTAAAPASAFALGVSPGMAGIDHRLGGPPA